MHYPGSGSIRSPGNIGPGKHQAAQGIVVIYLKGVSNLIFLRVHGIGDFQYRCSGINFRIVPGTADVKRSGRIVDRIDKESAVSPQTEAVPIGGPGAPMVSAVVVESFRYAPGSCCATLCNVISTGYPET